MAVTKKESKRRPGSTPLGRIEEIERRLDKVLDWLRHADDRTVRMAAPLIADGLYRVSGDPLGNTTVALVHVERSVSVLDASAAPVFEEQWILFDAATAQLDLSFVADPSTATNPAPVALTVATKPTPARLPWPNSEVPGGPTWWVPVLGGGNVSAASFYNGVRTELLKAGRPAFRYVWAALAESELTPIEPNLSSNTDNRSWEEELLVDGRRQWIYGETEQTTGGIQRVKIHIAYKGSALTAPDASTSTAFRRDSPLTVADWIADIRQRLGITSTVSGKYVQADAKLYTRDQFNNLSAKPTP